MTAAEVPDLFDFFISHASEDLKPAERLLKHLTDAKHRVFIDKTGIAAGMQWNRVLQDALLGSQITVALLSPRAFKYWVEEIFFSLSQEHSKGGSLWFRFYFQTGIRMRICRWGL